MMFEMASAVQRLSQKIRASPDVTSDVLVFILASAKKKNYFIVARI
jgi:hypothetical protein